MAKHVFLNSSPCLVCTDPTQNSKPRFLSSLLPSEVQGRSSFSSFSQFAAEMLSPSHGRDASYVSCGFLATAQAG